MEDNNPSSQMLTELTKDKRVDMDKAIDGILKLMANREFNAETLEVQENIITSLIADRLTANNEIVSIIANSSLFIARLCMRLADRNKHCNVKAFSE